MSATHESREVSRARPPDPLLSVVVPVLDEEGNVDELARRVREALHAKGTRYELIFVDDGSRDATPARILALQALYPGVRTIRFTRCFGHQAALVAGLRFARGDAVVTMDGDLQHPPELLPDMLAAWREGADVVHSVRRSPPGTRRSAKERAGRAFYRVMNALARVPVVPAGADFRLIDRRVVDAFNELQEHFVFLRGLIPWFGFRESQIEYEVGPRFAGRSKYRLSPMLRLAFDGIFAFSVVPLRLITLLGLLTTLAGLAYGIFSLAAYFTGHARATGWTSLVVLVLLFGGVQLLSVGILSEYVGRTYEEVKRRPRYVIDYMRERDPQ
ncbi:MAG TPA: glycosyltransferase family 2 protein [Myxococcota bacterium]|nr:glycosyltransferase family 2 protein [Myxococcota bacterium]